MLASNRWTGSRTAWCTTHRIVHSLRMVSALSFRERCAGFEMSGHVYAHASTRNVAKAAAIGATPTAASDPEPAASHARERRALPHSSATPAAAPIARNIHEIALTD